MNSVCADARPTELAINAGNVKFDADVMKIL